MHSIREMIPDFHAFTTMFSDIEDAVFLVKKHNSFLYIEYMNKTAINLMKTKQNAIGKRLSNVIPIHLVNEIKGYYNDVLNHKKSLQVKRLFHVKDRKYTFHLSFHPIVSANGDCNYVLAYMKDQTVYHENVQKLMDAEKIYYQIIDLFPDAVVVLKDMCIMYANTLALRLTGVKHVEEVIGQKVFTYIHPKERRTIQDILIQMNDNLTGNRDSNHQTHVRILQQDGNIVDTDVRYRAMEFNGEQTIMVSFCNITACRENQQRLEYMASRDPLINLYNRRALSDTIKVWIDKAHTQLSFTVLYIDMDNFKEVNDRWGHDTGDKLLIQFARRLENSVREHDLLCRIGGDEFIVVLKELHHQNHILEIIHRLMEQTQHPYQLNGHNLMVTISIGISIYSHDGDYLNMLIDHADQALYASKYTKNNYQFYS